MIYIVAPLKFPTDILLLGISYKYYNIGILMKLKSHQRYIKVYVLLIGTTKNNERLLYIIVVRKCHF